MSPESLKESMAQVQPGQEVEVRYMRYEAEHKAYRIYTVTVVAAERT